MKKDFLKTRIDSVFALFIVFALAGVAAFIIFLNEASYQIAWAHEVGAENGLNVRSGQKVKKSSPPVYVRGLYLTAYSASREQWRRDLIAKMKKGRINAVVIDIKDYTGYILYNSDLAKGKELKTIKPIVKDLKKVVAEFKEAGIYTIARQTVFQDPILAESRPDLAVKNKDGSIWRNYGGLAWVDPKNKEVWDYNIALANEAAAFGFDEINLDYIRYPSDGNLKTIDFGLPEGKAKSEVMAEFFAYFYNRVSGQAKISADMFGLVMDAVATGSDLGIGQRLKDALPYFDYICPMMYPSHYYSGYLKLNNPAAYPGEVVANGIKIAGSSFAGQRATLRPWLQAFDLGAVYNESMIDAQIAAAEKASTTGWLLWNARNYYPDHVFK